MFDTSKIENTHGSLATLLDEGYSYVRYCADGDFLLHGSKGKPNKKVNAQYFLELWHNHELYARFDGYDGKQLQDFIDYIK